jgi:hypothetical protein
VKHLSEQDREVLIASGGPMPAINLFDLTAAGAEISRPFRDAAAALPALVFPRGGFRYFTDDDQSPEARAARDLWRWHRIMDVAETILCTCVPERGHCGSCEGHRDESCPIHGDEGEWML